MAPQPIPAWQTVALLAFVVGVTAGVLLYSSSLTPASSPADASYCPFDVSNGMSFPEPGQTGNVSPNATSYAVGSVVFTASATGCVAPYTFTCAFGDGGQSQQPDVTHVYPGAGYYSGSLTVDDSAGHPSVNYFCVNASAWPVLGGASGNPAPPCP